MQSTAEFQLPARSLSVSSKSTVTIFGVTGIFCLTDCPSSLRIGTLICLSDGDLRDGDVREVDQIRATAVTPTVPRLRGNGEGMRYHTSGERDGDTARVGNNNVVRVHHGPCELGNGDTARTTRGAGVER